MKRVLLMLAALALAGRAQSLRIYTEEDTPLQVKAPDGSLCGITIDAVREIQKRVGNSDPIRIVPWARSYQEARVEPNVVLFSMTRTADRDPLFQWVGPVDENTYGFYVKADSPLVIRSLDDAKKLHAIGVYRDDVRDLFLTKAGFTNLDRVADNVTNVKKLLLGRIEAFASSAEENVEFTRGAGAKVSDLKEAFCFLKGQLFIAFSKRTPQATVRAWQDALSAMKRDRTFEAIYRRYEPVKPLPGPARTAF